MAVENHQLLIAAQLKGKLCCWKSITKPFDCTPVVRLSPTATYSLDSKSATSTLSQEETSNTLSKKNNKIIIFLIISPFFTTFI
jgi:hypothetical protein